MVVIFLCSHTTGRDKNKGVGMIQAKNKHKKQGYKDLVKGYKKVLAEKEQVIKEKNKLIQDLKRLIRQLERGE